MRQTFIAGNWKMYKTCAEAKAFAEEFKKIWKPGSVRVAIAAPYTQLPVLSKALMGSGIALAAQNVYCEDEGAYTGEVSPLMLEELGVEYCIIGHSERRQYFHEDDELINRKLLRILKSRFRPILCVGESLEKREAGEELAFVEGQIRAAFKGVEEKDVPEVTIAYEPIWAIGTGKTATPQQAQDMCAHIRKVLAGLYSDLIAGMVTIQYGGSVKPANVKELMGMDDIDGALVGGASLVPDSFNKIVGFEEL